MCAAFSDCGRRAIVSPRASTAQTIRLSCWAWLPISHAAFSRCEAGGPWHCACRRHVCRRSRSPKGLARIRRLVSPVQEHPISHLARLGVRRGVWVGSTALRGNSRSLLRPDRGIAAHRRVSAPGLVQAFQYRTAVDNGEPARHARRTPDDLQERMGWSDHLRVPPRFSDRSGVRQFPKESQPLIRADGRRCLQLERIPCRSPHASGCLGRTRASLPEPTRSRKRSPRRDFHLSGDRGTRWVIPKPGLPLLTSGGSRILERKHPAELTRIEP